MSAEEAKKPPLRKTKAEAPPPELEESREERAKREAAERRADREAAFDDPRNQLKEPIRPLDGELPCTQWRRDRLQLVTWRSGMRTRTKEVASAFLQGFDWPTWIYVLGTEGLADATGLSKRVVRLELAELAARGILLRSTADDCREARRLAGERAARKVFLRGGTGDEIDDAYKVGGEEIYRLHYDAHDERIIQPTRKRTATVEWREGFRFYKWKITEEKALLEACSSVAPPDQIDPGGPGSNRSGGGRIEGIRGGRIETILGPRIDSILPAPDQIDPPFVDRTNQERGYGDQTPLLSSPPRPPTAPPTSSLSTRQGDPPHPESETATPGGAASPGGEEGLVPERDGSAGEREGCEGRESKMRTAVGGPRTAPSGARTLAPDAHEAPAPVCAPEGAQAPESTKPERPMSRKTDHEAIRAHWAAAYQRDGHRLSPGERSRIDDRLDDHELADVLAVITQARRSPYNKPGGGRDHLLCLLRPETFERLLADARSAAAVPAEAADWVPTSAAEFEAKYPPVLAPAEVIAAAREVVAEVTAEAPESRASEYAEVRERARQEAFAEGRGPSETERMKQAAHEALRAAGLLGPELELARDPEP